MLIKDNYKREKDVNNIINKELSYQTNHNQPSCYKDQKLSKDLIRNDESIINNESNIGGNYNL